MTKAGGVWADKEFFNMFSYKLNSGLPNEMLKDKNAVVLSSSLAKAMYKFGLAAFNAEIRSNEMSIRKVLGASISSVV